MTADVAALRKKYEQAGQGHLFTYWDKLNEQEKEALHAQLSALDVDRVNRIFHKAVTSDSPTDATAPREQVAPLPDDVLDSTLDASADQIAQWRDTGLRAIARGEVGVLLMAGGQGTRLGSTAPKGCYDIGLPSHKSLFEYQAQRIASLQRLAAAFADAKQPAVVPWYVMTSGPTRPETVAFFERHQFFGLDPDNVIFFEQGASVRAPALEPLSDVPALRHSAVSLHGRQDLARDALSHRRRAGRQWRPLCGIALPPLALAPQTYCDVRPQRAQDTVPARVLR